MIPFNKPFVIGNELDYIRQAVESGKISGDGMFTKKCNNFFEKRYGFQKVLLTTSCTDALEMAALLLDIQPGDEVIIPSFTFVSTANAFVLRGAKIIFADSQISSPNIDEAQIESLITNKTKAIVVVHYAGIACDMDAILEIAKKYNLYVVEDAAHAIESFYKGKPLGSFGHLATFSFHETKNIISGEGGLLIINDERFIKRAEIIREKGTNRSAFFRGEVDKYGWVDIGSSFLPSDIIAAYLYAQLECIEQIQEKRVSIWNTYYNRLFPLHEMERIKLPLIPHFAYNNGHMFYMICRDLETRTALIDYLRTHSVHAVFHYISLHRSPYYHSLHDGRSLSFSDFYTDRLIRLPLFYELTNVNLDYICSLIETFFRIDK